MGGCRPTVQAICEPLQANAQRMQPANLLETDTHTETDEMYQNAKSEPPLELADAPRRRAHKQRGHGSYANDRPPMVGRVGRDSGKVRRRRVEQREGAPLCEPVEPFTTPDTHVYTDEWRAYNRVDRPHASSVMLKKKGRPLTMPMAFVKFIVIRSKAWGRSCAISCGFFGVYTKNSGPPILPSARFTLI